MVASEELIDDSSAIRKGVFMKQNVKIDPVSNLRLRAQVAEKCIAMLEQWPDDPRQPEALRHYKAQLVTIRGKIKDLERQVQEPPPVVIRLKTADLSGKHPKGID